MIFFTNEQKAEGCGRKGTAGGEDHAFLQGSHIGDCGHDQGGDGGADILGDDQNGAGQTAAVSIAFAADRDQRGDTGTRQQTAETTANDQSRRIAE